MDLKSKLLGGGNNTRMEYLGGGFDCHFGTRVIYHRMFMSTALNFIHSYFIHAVHLISALAQGLNLSGPTF